MTSKELSQDSKADKSQQLKKETKDQQRTHSVKEEICCVCEEEFCIVFRVRMTNARLWGFSSAGRAPALQAGGQRFEPANLHHIWVASSVG